MTQYISEDSSVATENALDTFQEDVYVFPTSFAQARLWFIDQLQGGSANYNMGQALRLSGSLDVAALEMALQEIVWRHEALRTTFPMVNGSPVQAIAADANVTLPLIDLQGLPESEQSAEVLRLVTKEAQQLFDLANGSLLRVTLLRLGVQEHVLLLAMHHIISDGWSMGVLVREMAILYEAFSHGKRSPLPELPIQYADFAVWQREWLQGEVLQTQLSYWKQQLGGNLPVLELPTDYPRPAIQTFQGGQHSFVLSQSVSEALKVLSQQEGTTLFMTLLAAFQTLLYRYTGQEDICVGSPIANRNRAEIEGLIGFFVNTLVLRTQLGGNPTFRELLGRVRSVTLGAYAYQDLPFEKLVEELQPERNLSHSPLFQVLFVLQNTPMPTLELSGLTLSSLEIDSETAKFDLTVSMVETEQGLIGSLEYNAKLFDSTTIARMAEHFQNLLEGIVVNRDRRLSNLPILSAAEQQLLGSWNNTQVDYPQVCIHQLFESVVEQTPDAVAVVFEKEQLTYRELNQRANQLAHYLKSLGVKPEVLVGICVDRSLEMVVGILGILKAGGAYVPLDPAYPQERLAFMIEDTQMPVLLTQKKLVAGLPEHWARFICLDTDWQVISQESQENPITDASVENLAYVIYTSGSTGRPKGVAMMHLPLCNLICWQLQNTTVSRSAKTLQYAPVSFDVSFQEIFSTWCSGGTLVLISEELRRDAVALLGLLTQEAVERLFLPFVALKQLAEAVEASELVPTSLREIITAGEQLQIVPSIANWFKQLTDCTLHNHYGPSESHVVTAFTLADAVNNWQALPPIGRPIAKTQIYLLDRYLQPVPIGVTGELYIGGVSLARGYINRPDLTAERFISNPFSDKIGARLYKTGDLARYLPDGNIEYLGRIDHQVKIRGFRIELGEIEALLSQHPEVREAIAVVREDGQGDKRLVAYLVTSNSESFTISDLRSFLKQRLPEYMVPSTFVLLDSLPLTPSGKVDRRALPVPDEARPELEETFVAPRDTWELQLTQIWEEILDVRPVGVRDNFFNLGGHSLLTVRLMAQIQKRFGQNLPLSTLFQSPTIEHLASILRQQTVSIDHSPLVGIQTAGNQQPFFCVHPAGGNVLCYGDLARHLGTDRPFYGLQALDVDEQQIDRMASHYIEAIRTIQPEGPYLLGGWSMGGVVAFEMAQQLQKQGQKVAQLILLDSTATAANVKPIDEDHLSLLASFAQDIGLSWENQNFSLDKFRQLKLDQQLAFMHEQAKKANLLSPDVELPQFRQLFNIFQSNVRAMWNYVPQAYSGRIVLFKASDRFVESSQDPTMGWGQLVSEGVEMQMIPGNHYTIVRKPHVQVLAEKLRVYLNLNSTFPSSSRLLSNLKNIEQCTTTEM